MSYRYIFRNNYFAISFLMLTAFWAVFYKLGEPDFYHTRNESRRAEIAREMHETGNFLVPHIENEPTLTKPPLYYWAVAFSYSRFGVNELAARIPSAVAGFGTIMATFLLGSFLFDRKTGTRASIILMSTNLFLALTRSAEMESLLTFFITWSFYFFFRGYRDPGRAALWYALFFVMMGFGTITKGPFALTFPLIPITAYLCIFRNKKVLYSKPFLSGVIFFFLIILPWPLLIQINYPKFFYLVFEETIGRALTGFAHREPFYYYFKSLPGSLFPWIFFLPFAVWICFAQKSRGIRKENVFLLLWFFGNIIFLSLSKSKREIYLLPAIPAVAIFLSSTWEPLWEWASEKIRFRPPIIKRTFFLSGFLITAISFDAGNPFSSNIPGDNFPATPIFLLFTGLSFMIISGFKMAFPQLRICNLSIVALFVLFLSIVFLHLNYEVPIRNIEDSGKIFYIQASKIAGKNYPLAFYDHVENYNFTYYAQRPIITLKSRKELEKFMMAKEKRFVVFKEKDYKRLPPVSWDVKLKSDYSEHKSWRGYVLLCNN